MYLCNQGAERTSTAQPMKSKPAPRFATVAGENAETESVTASSCGRMSPVADCRPLAYTVVCGRRDDVDASGGREAEATARCR